MASRALVALATLGLLTTGCGTTSSPRAVTSNQAAPVLMYTCCADATAKRAYHPGEVVTLHWLRSTGGQGRDTGLETLEARLDGPFAQVAQARRGTFGRVQATARPIKVAPNTASPISHLRIPAGAKPGLYKVTTTDVQGPGSLRSKTIIRVESPRR